MHTCEGDSGGPLQVKLLHNSRTTPFVVGVTSFGGVCGTSNPGVYAKVAFFYDWIVATMRDHGAVGLEEDYNATLHCESLTIKFGLMRSDRVISQRWT
ncbi:hypothetical protein quinque_010399 [Culex quinquefasciatus]